MAWLGINGSFIDAPAEAARRTDLVLHSTWQQPSCQYFQQHWIKMGDFHPHPSFHLSLLKSVFSVFPPVFLPHIASLNYTFLYPKVYIICFPYLFIHSPTLFLFPGWFLNRCSSLSTTVQPCESESNSLFNVNGSQMPCSPPFRVFVHLDDRRVLETRKKKKRRGHANRCLIKASAGKAQ